MVISPSGLGGLPLSPVLVVASLRHADSAGMVTTPINIEGIQGLPAIFCELPSRCRRSDWSSSTPSLHAAANGIKVPATASLVHCSGQIAATPPPGPPKLLDGTIGEKTVRASADAGPWDCQYSDTVKLTFSQSRRPF